MSGSNINGRHRRNFLKTLDRGMRVLATFTPAQPSLTLTQLAGKLSLDPGTAYRFVYTLEHLGYLRREPSGTYRLTSRVLDLGRSVHRHDELQSVAFPFMERLSRQTEETISLAVLDGNEILVLEQIESPHPVTVRRRLGERQPSYCTAQGKVLLAHLPAAEQKRLLASMKLEAYGPRTITDRAGLEAELRRTVQRVYAINDDEMDAGLRAVAAPIRASSGEVIAALSVDGPIARVSLADVQTRYADLVMKTAEEISRALG